MCEISSVKERARSGRGAVVESVGELVGRALTTLLAEADSIYEGGEKHHIGDYLPAKVCASEELCGLAGSSD